MEKQIKNEIINKCNIEMITNVNVIRRIIIRLISELPSFNKVHRLIVNVRAVITCQQTLIETNEE